MQCFTMMIQFFCRMIRGFFQNDWDFCKEIQELGIAILNPTNFCVSSQTVVSGIVFAYYGHFHFCLRKYLHHF